MLLLTLVIYLYYFYRKSLYSVTWKNNKWLAPFIALFLCCYSDSSRVNFCCVTIVFCFFFTLEIEFILAYFHCFPLREKCPNTEFFLFCILPYSSWTRRFTEKWKLRIWTIFTQCSYLIKHFHGQFRKHLSRYHH